ncbi:MAG: hypothetical protein WA294_21700 [Acidobacteriaceae bacterium]
MPEETVKVAGEPLPSKTERGRSTIEWPYFSLDDVTKLAKGIFELGGSCTIDQLAGHLNQAASGGAFRLKVQAARTFGLVKSVQGKLSLSELGTRVLEPEAAAAARVEAFFAVPLYRALYDSYRGKALPPSAGLEVAIVNLGVAPKQKEKARQAFQRSASDAGFFAYGSGKLVEPVLTPTKQSTEPARTKEQTSEQVPPRNDTTGSNGGGGGGGGYHPLIEGLIKALPPQATLWPIEARKKWLQAAAMNFDYVYNGDTKDDAKSIKVSVE